MNAQATAKLQSILNAITANEGRIEDDHHGASWFIPAYLFILEFVDKEGKPTGRYEVCPLSSPLIGCLNPIYLKDGLPRLSTNSCGGTIDMRGCLSLKDAIALYNDPERLWVTHNVVAVADLTTGNQDLIEYA